MYRYNTRSLADHSRSDRCRIDAQRIGIDAHRIGTDAHRIGIDTQRIGTDAHRIGTDTHRVGSVLTAPTEEARMREFLETDTGFYYAIGAFTIAVFLVAIAVLAIATPDGVGSRELVGLVVGFGLFMVVFFVSIAVHRLEDRDGI